MNTVKTTLIAALIGVACTAALAADPSSDQARQDRMDQAYGDYRNTSPGPAARTENRMKYDAHRAGSAVKHGAQRVGHAIGNGARKTGRALRGSGSGDATTTAPAQ